jgi:hypothetical protein
MSRARAGRVAPIAEKHARAGETPRQAPIKPGQEIEPERGVSAPKMGVWMGVKPAHPKNYLDFTTS